MATIKVQTEDFDVSREIAALTAGRTDIGGIGCFVGVVRERAGVESSRERAGIESSRERAGGDQPPEPVAAMTLEHYPGMTERAIARIAEQAEQRFDILGCTVIHRVGTLRTGDNIVLVLAVSAHRSRRWTPPRS